MNTLIELLNRAGDALTAPAGLALVQSSIVIAVLFAADWLLRDRVRAVVRHAIWLLALVKLLLPPTLALPTSPVYWFRQTTQALAQPALIVTSQRIDLRPKPFQTSANHDRLGGPVEASVPFTKAGAMFGAWLAVVALLLACLLQKAWAVRRLVARASPAPEPVNELLSGCAARLGVRRLPRLRVTETVTSPALCGLIRPVILLPTRLADQLSGPQLRSVLLHELAHFQRGDLWINHAQTLLQIAFWWHPLLWLANARIRRVREEAVDEAVLAALGQESDAYPEALLQIGKFSLAPMRGFIGLVGILESRSVLARRIERLLRLPFEPRQRIGWGGMAAVLAFGAILLPMASAQVKDGQTNAAQTPPDTIENPPQILIEVKWVEIKTSIDQPSPLTQFDSMWTLTEKPTVTKPLPSAGVLSALPTSNLKPDAVPSTVIGAGVKKASEAREFIQWLQETTGVDVLSAPKLATSSGRAASLAILYRKEILSSGSKPTPSVQDDAYVPERFELGLMMDVVPTVTITRESIRLEIDGAYREFLGYKDPGVGKDEPVPALPVFRQRRLAFNANMPPGSTLILAGADVANYVKRADGQPGVAPEQRSTLLLLVTPKLIDEKGEPLQNETSPQSPSKPRAAIDAEGEERNRGANEITQSNSAQPAATAISGTEGINNKYRSTGLNGVDFSGVPLSQSSEDLRAKTPEPNNKSIAVPFEVAEEIKIGRTILAAVMDEAVMPSEKEPAGDFNARLFTRVFKVSSESFLSQVRLALEQFTRTSQPTELNPNEAVRKYLASAGVEVPQLLNLGDLPSPSLSTVPPQSDRAIYYNATRGLLLARTTMKELDLLEKALHALNSAISIRITSQFLELPPGQIQTLKLGEPAAVQPSGLARWTLNADEAAAALNRAQRIEGVRMLGSPSIHTPAGQGAQQSVGRVMDGSFGTEQGATSASPAPDTEESKGGIVFSANAVGYVNHKKADALNPLLEGPSLFVFPRVNGHQIDLTMTAAVIEAMKPPRATPDERVSPVPIYQTNFLAQTQFQLPDGFSALLHAPARAGQVMKEHFIFLNARLDRSASSRPQ